MLHSQLNKIQQKDQTAKKVAIAVIVFFIIAFTFLLYKVIAFYFNIKDNSSGNGVTVTKTPEQKNTYNILLLGYGGGKHEGTYLTDTVIVLHTDLKKKKAVLISLPRDIWVKVPTKSKNEDFHAKINSIYQMGLFPEDYPGLDTTYIKNGNKTGFIKYAVSEIVGFPIDAYVAVDFDGFVKTIDILGGLDINVDTTFSDFAYPIEGKEEDMCGNQLKEKDLSEDEAKQFNVTKGVHTVLTDKDDTILAVSPDNEKEIKFTENQTAEFFTCRYETLNFKEGLNHMDGPIALKYARSRHSFEDGGDFNRAKRQQKVLESMKEKVLSFGILTKIVPLLDELDDYIETDISQDDIQKLLKELPGANEYTIIQLVVAEPQFLMSSRSDYGGYILIPKEGEDNWTEVKKDIKNIMLGITPTPTKAPMTPTIIPTKKKTL